ncbi:MAG: hypothetical protein IID38_07830, partial [Planctomycetes bacterium]|nr:hypothetical protein [Planctomycetota bacterium]
PGKDPAQVLTVLAILYAGLAGYTRSRRLPCLACGSIFALSLTIGLVHIWVVLILVAATLWQSYRRGPGLSHYLQRVILPAAIGFALVAACLQSLLGWNILKTSLAVVQRYPDVQVNVINGYWTMVGLPMFILFAGPMMWCLVTVLRRDRHDSTSSLGRSLVFSSAMVMTFSYFFANNNETPRLWIPFLALLPVGLAMGRDLFRRGSDQHRRICLVMIALQIGVSVLHWSMMDVRESEFRLLPGPDGSPPRMWG